MNILIALGYLVAVGQGWTLADVNTTIATRFQSVPYDLQMSVDVSENVRAYQPSDSQAAQLWQQDTSNIVTPGGLRLRNVESGLCMESWPTAPMLRMATCRTNYADQEFTTATTGCTGTPTGYSCTDVVRFKSEYSGTNTLYLSIATDGTVSLQVGNPTDNKQWMNLLTSNPCDSTDCWRCASGGLNPLANICGWCETRETCELGDSTNGFETCADWNYDNSQCLLPQDGTYQTRFCTGSSGTLASANMMTALTNALAAVNNNLDNYLSNNCQDSEYTLWFGSITSTRYSTVTTGFTRLRDEVNDGGFVLICDTQTPTCQASNYAYVYPNDPGHNIHICPVGMQSSIPLQIDSLPGTIIHEFTHFDDIRGTDDFAYGTSDAQSLATSNPDEAVMNADSYEYFSESSPGPCVASPPIPGPPASPAPSGACVPNPTPNSLSTALSLDLSSGTASLTGLRLCSSTQEIWYEFNVPNGLNSVNVQLAFTHANGDVDAKLYAGSSLVASGVGVSDQESFSETYPSSDTYYLQIYVGGTSGVSISGSVSFNGAASPPRNPPGPNAGLPLRLF